MGVYTRLAARLVLAAGSLWLTESQPARAQGIDGTWHGAIDVLGQTLPHTVHFSRVEGTLRATIDIQGATALALQNVSYDAPTVHFELVAGAGLAVWEGTVSNDSITGTFTQAGVQGTFTLSRTADEPAEEDEPVPYRRENVTFANGDVTLAGTLTIPSGGGPFPAVVTITGSGPQNRDEQLFDDYRPFRVIADHLTRHGIAVLRYDDRGVGGSTGNINDATSSDFANDALGAVAFLQTRAEIAGDRIGLIGHSEGGLVAPLAATRSDKVAFIVMLAGPGLSGEQILFRQAELIARAGGADEDAVAQQRRIQEMLFHAIRSGEGWDSVRALYRRQAQAQLERMPPAQRAQIPDEESMIEQGVDAQVAGVRTSWFRFFLDYDPGPTLALVKVPILALFGEKDLQVPAEPDRDAMQAALEEGGHPDFTLTILPGVNHLFLPAQTGHPSEYAAMDKTFAPGLLETITDWILARVGDTP